MDITIQTTRRKSKGTTKQTTRRKSTKMTNQKTRRKSKDMTKQTIRHKSKDMTKQTIRRKSTGMTKQTTRRKSMITALCTLHTLETFYSYSFNSHIFYTEIVADSWDYIKRSTRRFRYPIRKLTSKECVRNIKTKMLVAMILFRVIRRTYVTCQKTLHFHLLAYT